MTGSGSALVSVVIPSFNTARTIGLCLESVLAQTYPDIEVVVVDDASTDATAEIAERYGCLVIRRSRNQGPAVSRNRGIAASSGEIVFFLDSDVALAPDAVENAVRVLTENPSYGAVWGIYGARPLVDDGLVERVQVLRAHYRQRRKLGPTSIGHFAGGAVRRVVIDRLGGFDERLSANYNEDTEYGLRIADHFPMVRTDTVIGYHDDDHQVSAILRKYLRRAASLVPLFITRRGLRPGREATHRPPEIAAAFLATATLPLPAFSWYLAVAPLGFAAAFIVADLRMLAFVRQTAGWRLLAPCVSLGYLYSLGISVAALYGSLRYLVDPTFRRRYQLP
ncbi:glycosyltransferase family 2 protein [Natronosporangium hydrolyticum]|uniref:Glycosyltransferase family 2 protein n=1 Tax=Natronosporangium hydrolyticum TaxID=2811111 RepID=A0A895Y5B3_9ACTN|nr:glycosyltransferase family 2 protein [Natronosporangium hydrolyticum]QSB12894.1 glycosyltransferase family 2 protein [Natronosporangium hydrolyticum]